MKSDWKYNGKKIQAISYEMEKFSFLVRRIEVSFILQTKLYFLSFSLLGRFLLDFYL